MDIIEEYLHQQTWRHWDQYLKAIPLSHNDQVIDLGCSVGGVSDEVIAGLQSHKHRKANNVRFIVARK